MNGAKETAAVSVNDRLRAAARRLDGDANQNMQFVHLRYVCERLMARVGRTSAGGRWVLKGGVLMVTLPQEARRMTIDIDYSLSAGAGLSFTAMLREICAAPAEPEDGLSFSLVTEGRDAPRLIREEASQPTARAKLVSVLHCPRPRELRLTVDVTGAELPFEPAMREWTPTIRGFAPLTVPSYPWEMVFAEKLHAVMTGTMSNPRLRDYMDIIALHRCRAIDPGSATTWIDRVFEARGHAGRQHDDAVGLSRKFAADRQADWTGTLRRTGYAGHMPASLADAITDVRSITDPMLGPGESAGPAP